MSTVFELNLDNSIINPIYIAPNLPECRICLENEGELIKQGSKKWLKVVVQISKKRVRLVAQMFRIFGATDG